MKILVFKKNDLKRFIFQEKKMLPLNKDIFIWKWHKDR